MTSSGTVSFEEMIEALGKGLDSSILVVEDSAQSGLEVDARSDPPHLAQRRLEEFAVERDPAIRKPRGVEVEGDSSGFLVNQHPGDGGSVKPLFTSSEYVAYFSFREPHFISHGESS